jgi:hypothetical protein
MLNPMFDRLIHGTFLSEDVIARMCPLSLRSGVTGLVGSISRGIRIR